MAGLLAELHGRCLRLLCSALRLDCEGLSIAARAARRHRIITSDMQKGLLRIDVANALVRHLHSVKVAAKMMKESQQQKIAVDEGHLAVFAGAKATSDTVSGISRGEPGTANDEELAAEKTLVEQQDEEPDAEATTSVCEPDGEQRAVAQHFAGSVDLFDIFDEIAGDEVAHDKIEFLGCKIELLLQKEEMMEKATNTERAAHEAACRGKEEVDDEALKFIDRECKGCSSAVKESYV